MTEVVNKALAEILGRTSAVGVVVPLMVLNFGFQVDLGLLVEAGMSILYGFS